MWFSSDTTSARAWPASRTDPKRLPHDCNKVSDSTSDGIIRLVIAAPIMAANGGMILQESSKIDLSFDNIGLVFLMSGRQNPREEGIILAQANSRTEIDEIIQQDPFYTNQAAEYTVIEFLPSKCAAGLESLIKQ